MRWASGVVGCRIGVAYTPIPLEMMFWLSLCEVGVDVVEDVGRVRVKFAAHEGLCSVFRCVAGVVEWIVGVLVLAHSAWFVHAVTDGDSRRAGAWPGGRCGE